MYCIAITNASTIQYISVRRGIIDSTTRTVLPVRLSEFCMQGRTRNVVSLNPVAQPQACQQFPELISTRGRLPDSN
jgi:hypothetical protein